MATRKEYDGYDAATSITSNDLIKYKDGTSGTVYKITEENLSAQVQADLFDNAATTEAEVSTALSVIEKNGTISRITLQDLMIQMKGYKEYTFAIRQSGTDAPTITVIKDDFGLETPLSFARSAVGKYNCDISSLSNDFTGWGLHISNQIRYMGVGAIPTNYLGFISGGIYDLGDLLYIYTEQIEKSTGIISFTDGILQEQENGDAKVIISLRQTLT